MVCVRVVLRCRPPDGSLFTWVPGMSSPREDDHLSLLSSELQHLNVGIAALYEVWCPDSGEIVVGRYTYHWSGLSDGDHAQGVAVVVSNKLTPMIIELTPLNERTMRLRIRHSLGVVSWSLQMLRLRQLISS